MPLDCDEEGSVRGFQRFNDTIGGRGANGQARGWAVYSLMVLAVDPQAAALKDALQPASGFDPDFVGYDAAVGPGCMIAGFGHLTRDILK